MEKKIYYSFHDMPFSRDDYGHIHIEKPPLTSKTEILHLTISMLILSLVFTFSMAGGIWNLISSTNGILLLYIYFPVAVLGILTGFFFHEMSHKLTARRYGLWAEYRMYPEGLILALVLGIFFGFAFAAPGAVNVGGGARRFEFGRIAAAGPMANIVIGALSLILYLEVGSDTYYGSILGFVAMINIFLAFFNLLPFGPLDGKKVIMWSSIVWAVMTTVSLILLTTIMAGRLTIPGF